MRITDNDIIKMEHVTTIQLLAEKIGYKVNFDNLWNKSLSYLESFRNDLIPMYNDNLKDDKKCIQKTK